MIDAPVAANKMCASTGQKRGEKKSPAETKKGPRPKEGHGEEEEGATADAINGITRVRLFVSAAGAGISWLERLAAV